MAREQVVQTFSKAFWSVRSQSREAAAQVPAGGVYQTQTIEPIIRSESSTA
jgi:hypothetical protein